ncbi:hypothetical protein cypCar_00025112 [Cyprinus carpio]|nr:hypothetical protein cypCar_00025112 [Cyprinus carpio]
MPDLIRDNISCKSQHLVLQDPLSGRSLKTNWGKMDCILLFSVSAVLLNLSRAFPAKVDQTVQSETTGVDIFSKILEANKVLCKLFLCSCSSSVGRSGGAQQLSLSMDGCINYGIIEHELLHSLGFHHEHTRTDRDKYIWINWQNIPEASANNFQIKDTNLNTPYDYNSIMHYGRTAFAIQSGLETIIPIPNPLVSIGQRQELSYTDIQRINMLYECGELIKPM